MALYFLALTCFMFLYSFYLIMGLSVCDENCILMGRKSEEKRVLRNC